jgi:hypothetical protein
VVSNEHLLISTACAMQRLFSTFPNSWPGMGLLILRALLGTSGVLIGLQTGEFGPTHLLLSGMPIACGVLLFGGLWTPGAAILLAILLLWVGLSRRPTEVLPFVLFATAISAAMLGPGAWSLDAMLFGRKKIEIHSRYDAD